MTARMEDRMNTRISYPLYRVAYLVDWRVDGQEWTVGTSGVTDVGGDEKEAARRFAEAYAASGQAPSGATVRGRIWRDWYSRIGYLADVEIPDGHWLVTP